MLRSQKRRVRSALHRAIDDGHFKSIDYLLRMNANPNVRDGDGLTPLMRCCQLEATPIVIWLVKALLKSGADPTISDSKGINVLGQAIKEENYTLIKLLLTNNDIDLHHLDHSGTTILHYLADYGDEMATIVLESAKNFHISVDIANAENMTPIMLACFKGNISVARLFAQYGASLSARDSLWHLNALEWFHLKQKRLHSGLSSSETVDPFSDIRHISKSRPSTGASLQDRLQNGNIRLSVISSSGSLVSQRRHSDFSPLPGTARPSNITTLAMKQLALQGQPRVQLVSASSEEPLLRYVFSLYETQLSRSFCKSAVPLPPPTPVPELENVAMGGLLLHPDMDPDFSFNGSGSGGVGGGLRRRISGLDRRSPTGARLTSARQKGGSITGKGGVVTGQGNGKSPTISPDLRNSSASSRQGRFSRRTTMSSKFPSEDAT